MQEAQAQEFLDGPANGRGSDVALGDFNSAADGTSTASGTTSSPLGYRDAWSVNGGDPGYTSGQNGTLTNPVTGVGHRGSTSSSPTGAFRPSRPTSSGDEPFRSQTSPPRPIWPSDHLGVVATLRLR